jgi:hypothetical protein
MQKKLFFSRHRTFWNFHSALRVEKTFFFVKISHRNEAQLHSTTKETDQRHRTRDGEIIYRIGRKKNTNKKKKNQKCIEKMQRSIEIRNQKTNSDNCEWKNA